MRILCSFILLLSGVSLLFPGGDASAGIGIIPPYVTKGKQTLFTDGYYTLGQRSGDFRTRLTYDYGATDRLLLRARGVFEDDDSRRDFFRQAELGMKYELAEKNVWPVDVALYGVVVMRHEATHTRGYQFRLIAAKELGPMVYTTNLLFNNNFGEEPGQGAIEWRIRGMYRAEKTAALSYGAEYFGEFGTVSHLSVRETQSHLAGPLVSYRFNDATVGELGMLFGVSDAAPDAMLKWRLAVDF